MSKICVIGVLDDNILYFFSNFSASLIGPSDTFNDSLNIAEPGAPN